MQAPIKEKGLQKPVKIFIIEDHEVFRLGLKELINQEPDLVVCGETDTMAGARSVIGEQDPDMVILDLTLKDGNGIDFIKDMQRLDRRVPVLVLSMHDESLYAERSLNAGARGYVMKQETADIIIRAIRHILRGNIYVSEHIIGSILQKHVGGAEAAAQSPVERLSDRELHVFRLIGEGKASGEIARTMNVSLKTVGTYRERIKEKLNLKNAAELSRYAMHWVRENE